MRRWGGLKSCFSVECEGNGDMAVLDLQHCNLTSVPTDIFKAEPNLEELYLDANQIRELPRALFGLQSLLILGLSDNELTVLPSAVSNLANLREVDISKNGIIDLPENVKNCKCLEQFDASVNPIGKIPDGFTQLFNLTHLYLNDAFLDRLPSNFGRLSKLKILELRENHLRSLPESMSYFTQLERLDIGSNEFMELPAVVGCLVNLRELWMDNNCVRELPPEIGLLRQLLFLDVSKNRLERLPPEIECLQSLTDLYLSNNVLLELLDNIGSLGNLQTLKVDENLLAELPASIGRLSNLEELVINHNELESLPAAIGLLRKLRILYADENFLEAIPLELGSCTSITILSLRDNRLVRIPDDIGRMPNLQVINFACNRLECLPYTFRKLTTLKALWLSENQSKPMVPLQSDFDHGTQSHILTCYMFPQQPPADEVSEQYSEDSAGSIPTSLLEEQIRQRSSIVFNIDEDDYLTRLARYQSPYPKDVKDRATQYLASRRQQQQEREVTQPVIPSQLQCHQQEQHQYRHKYQHRIQHSVPQSNSTHGQRQQPPVPVVVQSVDRRELPQLIRPQEPPIPIQTSEQRRSQPAAVVHPLSSAQRLISNDITQRGHAGNGLGDQNREPKPGRVNQATVRSIPGERLIGGQSAAQEVTATRIPPVYQPPPPYTPRENRATLPHPRTRGSEVSVESQHSFREEMPSASYYQGRPGVLWSTSSSGGQDSRGSQTGEMHSFHEEEPSFVQSPIRPPSYYEATNQSDSVPFERTVQHVISTSRTVPNSVVINGLNSSTGSPPPQYTVQPKAFAQPPVRHILPEPEAPRDTNGQPVAPGRPEVNTSQTLNISQEDAERFENRVRQLQRERAMERGEVMVDGTRTNVGDNRRPHNDASSIRVLNRSNSSESRNSVHSVSSAQEEEESEPVDNDPTIDLIQVEVYKNPNLGFSIAGGVGSTSNPFHPNDNKSIYVTKVQPDGPAAFGLMPGDRILEVNGINLRRVTHEKAVMFLKHNQCVNLLIARKKDQPRPL
ncbi:leucine-rich repeat-containing protein 7-like isoform X2 [Stylophora pistillata]|uniref:leucine-rich repeat-containing protein 7-like isoform X2 n=1 Tax=Stylophora pistillata TaxID=50429 RepID=UPI000C04DECD|nr:leucine-rich repeat-containing protein 7-like isoform X2 [Stylophora pistillata]